MLTDPEPPSVPVWLTALLRFDRFIPVSPGAQQDPASSEARPGWAVSFAGYRACQTCEWLNVVPVSSDTAELQKRAFRYFPSTGRWRRS
jgi:hypothetical protein